MSGHRQQQFTKIVLELAGAWRAREDVVAAIAASSPGWKYAGRLLVQTATHRTFHLDVVPQPGGVRLRMTAPAGTFDMARLALAAAAALVAAGATHMDCASSGGRVAALELGELTSDTAPAALARAFVAVHDEAASTRSCGMQCLGLPDAIVEGEPDAVRSVLARFHAELIGGWKPPAGGRFDTFALTHETIADIGREDPRYNPYGRWRLRP